MYTLTTLTRPEDEPVSLTLAKTHLRIDHDSEDDLIRMWVKAAREYCEQYTGRRFVTQTVRLTFSCWPPDRIIRLPFGPGDVTEVTAFTYLDENGDSQTLAADEYQVDLAASPPVLMPLPFEPWPNLELDRLYPITIELTVGANPPDVPAMVKSAILLTLAYWDENRGGAEMETSVSRGLPAGALRLLDMIWTGSY